MTINRLIKINYSHGEITEITSNFRKTKDHIISPTTRNSALQHANSQVNVLTLSKYVY